MSLALWSSHQLFQRMDSALRSLLSHHRHQVQTNLSLKPTHPQRPLRVLRVAQLARDDFGTLLCCGVLAMIVFQVFENVGMSMRIMPVTGIPLPFLSYGGSSMLTTCAGIGIILSVHMHRFR